MCGVTPMIFSEMVANPLVDRAETGVAYKVFIAQDFAKIKTLTASAQVTEL